MSVTPVRGASSTATPVLIHGTGFSLRTIQPAAGGAPSVDETFLAWIGDRSLDNVRWVDDETLSATVPAGLAAGLADLRVQGPFGTSGLLPGAFTVDSPVQGALGATIDAQPPRVNVGQSIAVTLTLTNTGTGIATNVIPESPTVTGPGTVGAPAGPTPASIASLAPGASGNFTWTYPAAGAGALAFEGSARMTDAFSGATSRTVTNPGLPARVVVERPAALTGSLPAAGSVAVGQEFTVAMTVVNGGGAGIKGIVPNPPTLTPGGMATLKPGTGAVPASVALLAAGGSATFTWTFLASAASGTVRIGSGATGIDVNSGTPVSTGGVTSGIFTIGEAGMLASLVASPATVNAGRAVTLTLTARNPGLADVQGFGVGMPVPTAQGGASATLAGGPSPVPPPILAAGQSVSVAWTFTLGLSPGGGSGRLDFVVALAGRDAFSGGSVTAQPAASVIVQTPAEVTPTGLVASPAVAVTTQPFTLTLGVEKTGTATATITGVSLTGTACTAPPSTPVEVSAATNLTWTGCTTPATSQTLALAATATWVDANAPLVVRTTSASLASLPVLQRASLAVTFQAQPPPSVEAGQPVNLVVDVRNPGAVGGEGAANVGVTPIATRATGTASGTCAAATPAMDSIPAGAVRPFTFACTPVGFGSLTFTAIASGVGAASGTGFSTEATTVATTILAPASLAVSFPTAPPPTVSAGQVIPLTATVLNPGGSAALAVGVTPGFTLVAGTAAASCGLPAPASATVPAGGSQQFTFDCAPSGSGVLTFGATAAGVRSSTGTVLVGTAATVPVTVQVPATVTATALGTSANVRVGATYSVTLSLARAGEAGAMLTGATLTGTGVNCTPPTFPVVFTARTATLTWTACTPLVLPLPVPISATATWEDVNIPGSPATTAPFPGTIQPR
jgi:hypothetical protein